MRHELNKQLDDALAAVDRVTTHHVNEKTPAHPTQRREYIELTSASSIKPERIHWLWPGWLARGKLHLLAGSPGTGKTTIALSLAAAISKGGTLPSGEPCLQGNVLIWSGEDCVADTLVPRLRMAGASMDAISFIGDAQRNGSRAPFDLSQDVELLAASIDREVSLIVIDPLICAISGDAHRNNEVRRGLAPLVDLAAATGAALLGITHYSKGTQGRDPLERINGSIGFGAVARAVFATRRDQSDGATQSAMRLVRIKSNIGAEGGGFRYRIDASAQDSDGIIATCIAWGEALSGSAMDLMDERPEAESRDSGPISFLRDLLADTSKPATMIYDDAKAAGFSNAQIHRASKRLKVRKEKAAYTGGWHWSLPRCEGDTEGCEDGDHQNAAPS